MRINRMILFVILFVFWIAISGTADMQHLIVGVVLSFAAVLFWHVFDHMLPKIPTLGELLLLGHCFILMIGYVIQANIALARILLFDKPQVSPVFMEMETGIQSKWGRVLLATCITITPGTITVDINPDTNRIIVHAITTESAHDLLRWRMIYVIRDLETYRQRRKAHALDTGNNDGAGASGTDKGNNRTDNH